MMSIDKSVEAALDALKIGMLLDPRVEHHVYLDRMMGRMLDIGRDFHLPGITPYVEWIAHYRLEHMAELHPDRRGPENEEHIYWK